MIFVFDGLDGCGKSTYIRRLQDFYESKGKKVKVFRNPGGTAFGEKIRPITKGKDTPRSGIVDLLTLAANWVDILEQAKTFVEKGYVVLIDRGPMSAYAYQGEMKGLGHFVDIVYDFLIPLYARHRDIIIPKVLFYIDVPYELLYDRLREREDVSNEMYEGKGIEWYNTLRLGYEKFFEETLHKRSYVGSLVRHDDEKLFDSHPIFGRVERISPTDNTKHEHNRLLSFFRETIDKEMGWTDVDSN